MRVCGSLGSASSESETPLIGRDTLLILELHVVDCVGAFSIE